MNCIDMGHIVTQRMTEAGVFTKRFSTFTKAEYDTLIFTIYLDMLRESERIPRDYEISVELGITEARVRSLRNRSQLLYPNELLWKDELERAIKKGSYNPSNMTITIMIEDPSVQNYIKYRIEKTYGIVDREINPKHLTLPIEDYVLLLIEAEENVDEVIEKLNKKWRESNRKNEAITKEKFLKRVWSKAGNVETLKILLKLGAKIVPTLAAVAAVIS